MDKWGNQNKIAYALERRDGLKTAWEHILNLSENITMAKSSLYKAYTTVWIPISTCTNIHMRMNEQNPTQKVTNKYGT